MSIQSKTSFDVMEMDGPAIGGSQKSTNEEKNK